MKNPLRHLALVLFPIFLFAQNNGEGDNTAYDSIFYHTYMVTATTDLDRALWIADSLYNSSRTDLRKIRSLMLISDMYHRKADRDSSLHYAALASNIAEAANIYDWQARINGVLSTQYRKMGLLNQGKVYLEKGLEASKRMEPGHKADQFMGQVYQEKGSYALEEEEFGQAINHFRTAQTFHNTLPPSPTRAVFLSHTEEQLGTAFLRSNQLDSAQGHFHRALELAQGTTPDKTVFKGFIYLGLGEVHLAKKEYNRAIGFLDKALDISDSAGLPDFKADVYLNLAQYHKAVGNIDRYTHFNDQYIKVVRSNVRNNRHFADNVIARTEDRLAALSQSKQSILLGALVLLALLVLGALFLWKGRGGRGARPKRPSEGEGGLLGPMDPSLGGHPGRSGDTAAQDRLMPEETEASILEQLKTFEQGTQYLQPNLSLAQLAVEFQVNTKYLSHTINNHKGNDFNNYINGLRIQYIIQKLRENPEYLNYKISYLSSECGFSSHSKFSSAFKHVTGHTPSAFSEKVRNGQMEL